MTQNCNLRPWRPYDVKDLAIRAVDVGRAHPPGGDPHIVLFHRRDFFIELRNVLVAPIVCQLAQPKLLEHGGTFLRAAACRVERNNAPRDQIVASKDISFPLTRSRFAKR